MQEITEWLLRHSDHVFEHGNLVQPSTGFVGVAIATLFCKKVNLYEFVPSYRSRDAAGRYMTHYYDGDHDYVYDSWTSKKEFDGVGEYFRAVKHPLVAEKLALLALNSGSEEELVMDGKVSFPGYPSLKCQEDEEIEDLD